MSGGVFSRVQMAAVVVFGLWGCLEAHADLALHYAFDGNVSDASGNANDGTLGGGLTFTAATNQIPVGSGALRGDGGDASFVALSSNLTFGSTAPWSVAFWAQRGEVGASRGMVLGKRSNDQDFVWLNDSFTGFRFRNSSGSNVEFDTPKDLLRHHYVLVAEGNGTMSLYLDGALVTNKTAANTAFTIDTVGLAYTTNSLHYAFKGVLDEVRVYDQALTAPLASQLFEEGRALMVRYAFDGSTDDGGGRGNDGTLAGNAALAADPAKVCVASGALVLDGADTSAVTLSQAVTFTNGALWTAAFWARRDAPVADKGMVMGRAGTTADFIWLNTSFTGFRFRSSAGTTVDFAVTQDARPHHYALVSAGAGSLRLYVDGALAQTKSAADTSFMVNSVGQAYPTSSHYGFQGSLDEVRLYNYAVDDAAVSNLFASGGAERLHYAFEASCADAGPYGNDGTASGNAALSTDADDVAVGAGGLALDGTAGSYVTLSNAVTFGAGAPWTAAFWARRGELGANKGMVMGARGNTADFIWLNDSYTGLRFRSSDNQTVDFNGPKDLGTHHYALVAESNGTMSAYVDGVLITNRSVVSTRFSIDTVGQAYSSSGYEFNGALDDVRVFSYALAATNVAHLVSLGSPSAGIPVTHVHVFLQGGQSNSEGRADPTQLPTSPVNLQGHQNDVDFYYLNVRSTLYPATTSGTQFGPEITCGRRLVDRLQPDASNRVAIVKYSVGGTTLYSDWAAGGDATTAGDGPRYVSFQTMVANGLAALASAYPQAEITIEGMIWMQGESDVPSASAAYYANLTNFIADVRLTYGLPQLPFIVGRLSASQTGAGLLPLLNVVRQAQTAVAAGDPWTGLVDTDSFSLKSDWLHFDAAGQQDMGKAFAEQLLYFKGLEGLFTPEQIAAGANEPDADPDGDGLSNWSEYWAGTDPADAGSVFRVAEPTPDGAAGYVLSWSSVAGRLYTVSRSTNLVTQAFEPVATGLAATSPLNVYTDATPASAAAFYRITADREE